MMIWMLLLNSLISIQTSRGPIEIPFVHRVEIESSWKDFTDTCRIYLAKKIFVKGADFASTPIQEILSSGDTVSVYLGYDSELFLEFKGYINRVHPKVPLVIECQDEMWKLKQTKVSPKQFTGGKISDVVKHIAPGYKYDVLDSSLGGWLRIDRDAPTPIKVLQLIEDRYGLKSFFKLDGEEPVLVVGKQYLTRAGSEDVKYIINENVIKNGLEFRSKDEVEVQVKVRSKQSDGKVLHNVFKGDPDGDVKSLTLPGLTQSQVEEYARRLYDETKTDRMDGTITTFGLPRIVHGQVADVNTRGSELPQSRFYVDAVSTSFGVDGFRRTIELGAKAV